MDLDYEALTPLASRTALYDFGTNPTTFHEWMFGLIEEQTRAAGAAMLEVGCGLGTLWKRNKARIPSGRGAHGPLIDDESDTLLETIRARLDAAILAEQWEAVPFRRPALVSLRVVDAHRARRAIKRKRRRSVSSSRTLPRPGENVESNCDFFVGFDGEVCDFGGGFDLGLVRK